MGVPELDAVLRERGASEQLDEFVVAGGFAAGGEAAFALGDGTLRVVGTDGAWRRVAAHRGGILAMAPAGAGWVTGGDDGRLLWTGADGAVRELAAFGSRWVEQVAGWSDGKAVLLAGAVGKALHVFGGDGAKLKELAHPSTVSGVAFDAKGKRVVASHYNGVSIWFVGSREDKARVLEWKGSHLGVAMHPAGEAVVTAMQENALHGWRLSDGQHMRMSGYPSKTESLSFSRNGKWLASSGAESVVLWPFFGGGPMGKAPTELAGGDEMRCTRVAFHPREEMVAAGFADGLVVVADVASGRILLISGPGSGPTSGPGAGEGPGEEGRGAVSALAWSGDGARLLFGTAGGFAALVDLGKR